MEERLQKILSAHGVSSRRAAEASSHFQCQIVRLWLPSRS